MERVHSGDSRRAQYDRLGSCWHRHPRFHQGPLLCSMVVGKSRRGPDMGWGPVNMDDLPEVCTPIRGIHEVGESLSLRTQAGLGAHRASKGVHRQQEANLALA